MSFALSTTAVVVGLGALAGVLVLLQRLRVRHREVTVVTTLFWKEAVEEARARVLVKRFRHPLAYLFILAIASLLWLAFAEPRVEAGSNTEYVVLIDASAGMSWGTRYDDALELAREEAARLPRERTRVLHCGSSPLPLLAPGEDALLLDTRLAGLSPEACPATIERTVRELAATVDPACITEILVVGDAFVDGRVADWTPDHVRVVRLARERTQARSGNVGITSLGVSQAASGAWNRVDVLVELRGDALGADTRLALELDGAALDASGVRADPEAGRARIVFADLPAQGGRLALSLEGGDSFAIDDRAAIRLPDRPLVRVALSPSLRAALGPALEADPAIVLDDREPDVVVRREGEAIGEGVPALEFVPPDAQEEAFLLRHDGADDSLDVLLRSVARLGLHEIDATGIARATNVPISVGALPAADGTGRGIAVWDVLLTDDFNFTQSRSFPLFVAQAVRWLVDEDELVRHAAAGEGVPERSEAFAAADGTVLDPLGADFVPPRAGDYAAAGIQLTASLLDPAATLPVGRGAQVERAEPGASVGAGWGLITWLVLVAFLALLVEWTLFRSGRMP